MTAWVCKKGACLLVPSGPQNKKHLFALPLAPVVVAGYGPTPMVLMAGVTTIYEGIPYDDACVLSAGEHPFVTHESYVEYRLARIEQTSFVESKVASNEFALKEDCSDELIRKILSGALHSRRISRELKQIVRQALGL